MTKAVDQILPIVVDTPTDQPELGYDRYVNAIVAAIMGGRPANYTVGIFGPWGTGKSSILRMIDERLKKWSPQVATSSEPAPDQITPPIVVKFDAWRFDSSKVLLRGLLAAIERAVVARSEASAEASRLSKNPEESAKKRKLAGILSKTTQAIRTVASTIELSVLGVSVGFKAPEGVTHTAANDEVSRSPRSNPADGDDSLQTITSFKDIGEELDEQVRIVILVDDLDRCSPDGVVKVIEALHILTDITGIVFVLALDYEYLTAAVGDRYPRIDADRFVEKIVQVPFHIPTITTTSESAGQVIPGWNERKRWIPSSAHESLADIISIALRSNPRQIKRFFNTFLLASTMTGGEVSPQHPQSDLLLRMLGLQIAWPTAFTQLHRELSHDGNSDAGMRLGELGFFKKLILDRASEDTSWSATASAADYNAIDNRNRLRRYFLKVLDANVYTKDIDEVIRLTNLQSIALEPAPPQTPTEPTNGGSARPAPTKPGGALPSQNLPALAELARSFTDSTFSEDGGVETLTVETGSQNLVVAQFWMAVNNTRIKGRIHFNGRTTIRSLPSALLPELNESGTSVDGLITIKDFSRVPPLLESALQTAIADARGDD